MGNSPRCVSNLVLTILQRFVSVQNISPRDQFCLNYRMSFWCMMTSVAMNVHDKFNVNDGKMSAMDVTMHDDEKTGGDQQCGGETGI